MGNETLISVEGPIEHMVKLQLSIHVSLCTKISFLGGRAAALVLEPGTETGVAREGLGIGSPPPGEFLPKGRQVGGYKEPLPASPRTVGK